MEKANGGIKTKELSLECGLIMPISQYGAYSAEFWGKVRHIVCEAINQAGMTPHPVWEDDKNDIIHAKIIRNIDTLPIIIGVIVGQNPNVMLECGMRLWKNLPILLLYSEGEKIPFDVSPIPCIPFPSSFDYFQTQKLKEDIVQRLKLMIAPDYKSFKSYYSLPAEVDMLNSPEKMDFNQFVEEIRGGFNSLTTELRDCKSIFEEHVRDSIVHGRQSSSSSLSADVYQYYPMGAMWPTIGGTRLNNTLSGEASSSIENTIKENKEVANE